MNVQHFFDSDTGTLTYILFSKKSGGCVIIDPVLSYDQVSGVIGFDSVRRVIEFIEENNLTPEYYLDTHIHADHLTGSGWLKKHFRHGRTVISQRVLTVLDHWVDAFDMSAECKDGTKYFDMLSEDDTTLQIDDFNIKVIATPGHTPSCSSYYLPDLKAVFVGDTLFAPQSGTARVDFPGGDADVLYRSIHKILSLPDDVLILPGHHYPAEGILKDDYAATVKEHCVRNIMINTNVSCEEFTRMRRERDANLSIPRLMYPSIQFNMFGGSLDYIAGSRSKKFFKIPVTIANFNDT